MNEYESPVQRMTQMLVATFDEHRAQWKELTKKARGWFERRDWLAAQEGSQARLELYGQAVTKAKNEARRILGPEMNNRQLWNRLKAAYSRRMSYRNDEELAETFFNSVVRAVQTVVGVDSLVEYVWFDIEILPSGDETMVYRAFHRTDTTRALLKEILEHYRLSAPYADLEGDAELAARAIDRFVGDAWSYPEFDAIELLEAVFYRNKGAYLVGRLRRANRVLPFVLPLVHGEQGIALDTVLLTENEVSTVFSYTRSYFFVDAERPIEVIGFLRSILPVKPVAELYISLGFTKHGKTVLYRHLHRHLAHCSDKFEIARGEKGMVMAVFTLPSYELVFKVIRDKFAFPKKTSREEVKKTYRLVHQHDRVGRLMDTQEFEYLRFERERFTPELLEELRSSCAQTVTITEDTVIFQHLYSERRLNPLNIYVQEVSPSKAKAAVVDFGRAIKELAAANIFPGDLLVKNFGVTRQGRVVFYDYDEICRLDQVNFRRMPVAMDSDEEMASEPWFFVDENDVFPEEFRNFLWKTGELREVMEKVHGDLFTVEFWQNTQNRVKAGVLPDVFPYAPEKRFRPNG